jgi:ubiquinone/menaquinone biosynthesis C-methylase UbiE
MRFKTFFAEQARTPSGFFGRIVMSKIFDLGNVAVNDFMKEMLSLQENDHVLEIGFGTGKLIRVMAALVGQGYVEGIDISHEMVALAEKKNKKYIAEGKVVLRQGDFEKAEYRDNRFDKICSSNTIYFWPDPDRYIQKMRRILKPGGKLIIAFEDKVQMARRQLDTDVFALSGADEIKALMHRSGFAGGIKIFSRKIKSQKYHCAVAVK